MEVICKRIAVALFLVITTSGLGDCGGSSSSSPPDQNSTAIPINVSIQKMPLAAGAPTTITFAIHGQHDPYTDVTIDLAKTLQAANITVTATP